MCRYFYQIINELVLNNKMNISNEPYSKKDYKVILIS